MIKNLIEKLKALRIYAVIRSFFFRKKAWLIGYDVCYKTPKHGQPKAGEAYCKRRRGHFGKHRTGSGYEFDRNCV